MSKERKKTKTHWRVIGNAGGANPNGGVSGNAKSRHHYPVAQEAQYCPRASQCARKRSSHACKYECNLYSMFKPKKGNRKEKVV